MNQIKSYLIYSFAPIDYSMCVTLFAPIKLHYPYIIIDNEQHLAMHCCHPANEKIGDSISTLPQPFQSCSLCPFIQLS